MTAQAQVSFANPAFERLSGRKLHESVLRLFGDHLDDLTVFELEALEGMPCGCVAAAYRARPWDVAVVSLEAKMIFLMPSFTAAAELFRDGAG